MGKLHTFKRIGRNSKKIIGYPCLKKKKEKKKNPWKYIYIDMGRHNLGLSPISEYGVWMSSVFYAHDFVALANSYDTTPSLIKVGKNTKGKIAANKI